MKEIRVPDPEGPPLATTAGSIAETLETIPYGPSDTPPPSRPT